MKFTLTILAIIGMVSVLTACDQKNEADAFNEPLAIANPAAVFCTEQGGSYNLKDSSCTLANGNTINAWDLLKSHQDRAQKPIGMANPAAVFCTENGSYDLKNGKCELKDGSVVDAWEYFRAQHSH